MVLKEQLRKGFEEQLQKLGYKVSVENSKIVAIKDDVYLSLELLEEQYGAYKVTFAQISVLIGDYKKALEQDIMDLLPTENLVEINDSSYCQKLQDDNQVLDQQTISVLENFKALNSCFYKDKDVLFFQQKGTHDLVLKDPVFIQAMRGKAGFSEIISQLKQMNLPEGWIIQKPKGLGKASINNRWKVIGQVVSILSFLTGLVLLISRFCFK